jgi:hypothetical protein
MAGGARVLCLCSASGGSGRFPSLSHIQMGEVFMVGARAQRHGFCAPGAPAAVWIGSCAQGRCSSTAFSDLSLTCQDGYQKDDYVFV